MSTRVSMLPGGRTVRSSLAVLWGRRALIGATTAGFTILAAVVSLVMPRVYESRAALLPPISSSSKMMAIPGMEASLGLLGISDETGASAKLFVQILRSRTVAENVIRQKGLLSYYRLTGRPEREAYETAAALLHAGTDFTVTDAGVIDITVRFATSWFAPRSADDRIRDLAAGVANEFIAQLDHVNREKSLSRAKQTRVYLEAQLAQNDSTIKRLSAQVEDFQRTHGAVALDAQTKALIQNAAELQGQLLSKQVELGVSEQTMTPENPVVRGLKSEIEQLQRGLAGLQAGGGGGGGGGDASGAPRIDLSGSTIPAIERTLAEYEREVQAQLVLQQYLDQQYYQAKIEEARDTPTIQVLDAGVAPFERFSPKRKLIVVGGLLSGLIVGILVAAVREGLGAA